MSDRASTLFDRLVGYQIGVSTYKETTRYDAKAGHKLRISPLVTLIDVKARTDDWIYGGVFGKTDWTPIDTSLVAVHKRQNDAYITLPMTMFGTHHTEIDVTYTAGLETIPDDVLSTIDEIDALLDNGEITEWNVVLPDRLSDVIDRYKKEVE